MIINVLRSLKIILILIIFISIIKVSLAKIIESSMADCISDTSVITREPRLLQDDDDYDANDYCNSEL